jgi:hypothetical protein
MKCDTIFGYGSLVNDKSRHNTISNRKTKRIIPAYIDKRFGYKKKYNVINRKELFLGLEESKDISKDVYGLLFDVTKKDLNKLSRRERYYKLKKIPSRYLRTSKGRKRITSKNVCTFVPKRKYQKTKRNQGKTSINPEYERIVIKGFQDYELPLFRIK